MTVHHWTCTLLDMSRADEAETALTEWKRQGEQHDAERDPLVCAAHKAGLNVHRIHTLSGVSRTTIYKILGLPGSAEEETHSAASSQKE